ncbi:MAG: response regulator transcription factor [Flavobacteriaceae bacterium]|nr:response regulator transcription factor [Flavobacteriaceae bacterium]
MKKILIIDDDKMIVTILQFRLEKEKFNIIVCEDGKKAKKLMEVEKPDLVIADIMMPMVSGLEIVNFIRNKKKWDIPIMVLSSINDDKTLLEAYSLGADEFVTKPFSPEELVIRIKKMLLSARSNA